MVIGADDADESEGGRNETNGAFWTRKLEGAPDELPSSPRTAIKKSDRVKGLILHILALDSFMTTRQQTECRVQ
jgi:hypothetical protein